ncbi:hypothetical protein [Frigoribacterium sp. RIT-PI-h]|uniref:hypothetical protein n=1 Tax=Frigoribacterium sp. RIT-PI-h TaxID=1690245 RepID=UPI000ABCEB1E|nr:hypothetical protein [Frigoribacterium sp. RIT-PI-h]
MILAADVLERSRGYRPDGIGLIFPGLMVTTLTVLMTVIAFLCPFVRGGDAASVKERLSSGIAIAPPLLTVGVAALNVHYLSSQLTFGAPRVWFDVACGSAILLVSSSVALSVATFSRATVLRQVALGTAIAAFIGAAVLQPLFLSGIILSSALALCSVMFSMPVTSGTRTTAR